MIIVTAAFRTFNPRDVEHGEGAEVLRRIGEVVSRTGPTVVFRYNASQHDEFVDFVSHNESWILDLKPLMVSVDHGAGENVLVAPRGVQASEHDDERGA